MFQALPMYGEHPYFSLQDLGKKSAQYTWQSTGSWVSPRFLHWTVKFSPGKASPPFAPGAAEGPENLRGHSEGPGLTRMLLVTCIRCKEKSRHLPDSVSSPRKYPHRKGMRGPRRPLRALTFGARHWYLPPEVTPAADKIASYLDSLSVCDSDVCFNL